MDIRNCPECGDDTMSAGLASWPGIEAPVEVTRCASDACDWVAIDDDVEVVVARQHSLAA